MEEKISSTEAIKSAMLSLVCRIPGSHQAVPPLSGRTGSDLYPVHRHDGFLGRKVHHGRLFSNNKFGSIYKLDGDIEKRWEKYKKRFRKEE